MIFNFDLKHKKLELLSDIFKQEHIESKGIYHIQRQIPYIKESILQSIASYDIAQLEDLFSKGTFTHVSKVISESNNIMSITMRLENGSIFKYVVLSNNYFEPRLRLNFSVSGRVFEYDDEKKYLSSTTHLDALSQLDHKYDYQAVEQRLEHYLKEVSYD